jgi:hypothetical protein
MLLRDSLRRFTNAESVLIYIWHTPIAATSARCRRRPLDHVRRDDCRGSDSRCETSPPAAGGPASGSVGHSSCLDECNSGLGPLGGSAPAPQLSVRIGSSPGRPVGGSARPGGGGDRSTPSWRKRGGGNDVAPAQSLRSAGLSSRRDRVPAGVVRPAALPVREEGERGRPGDRGRPGSGHTQ